MVRISFQSTTFSGTESSEVISATSGGIVSSRDISVLITFTPVTAQGTILLYCYLILQLDTLTVVSSYDQNV